jgi:negative regulator of genetic competence, sporulation and motility
LFFIFHIPQLLLSKENKEEEEEEEEKKNLVYSFFSFVRLIAWFNHLTISTTKKKFLFFFSDIYFWSMLDLLFSI